MVSDVKVKRPLRYALVFLWTLPADLIVWLVVFLIWALWGTKLQWVSGLWCELKPKSWPARSWYRYRKNGKVLPNKFEKREKYGYWLTWGGTTLGHGGFYGPGRTEGEGIDTKVEYHEHIHVEQFEVAMLTAFIIGAALFAHLAITQDWVSGLIGGGAIWIAGFFLKALSGWVTAWFRGESPYWGSTHEESAYAQTDQKFDA